MVSAVLYFVCVVLLSHLFFSVEFSQWLPRSFFFPGNNSLQLLGLPPSFVFSHNMSQSDNGQTVMAAVTSQVKLCPYNEEELAIWFYLIETVRHGRHKISEAQVCQCFG
jgi:hypothetical protein